MKELLFKEEVFQLVGFCMEIQRELGKGHDEVIYKDALVVELSRAQIPFSREKNYEVIYKGVILPHFYYADFVIWDKILFEGKAAHRLTDAHVSDRSLKFVQISTICVKHLCRVGSLTRISRICTNRKQTITVGVRHGAQRHHLRLIHNARRGWRRCRPN